MFEVVIVGIDGRPHDAETLAFAQQLAEPGAEIIAAKIAVVDHARVSSTVLSRTEERLADAEAVVEAFTEPRVRTEGVIIAADSVGQGLRDLAIGASADLIVVASSRRGTLGRLLAGDAVKDVLLHAPCPVAVATAGRVPTGPLRRVTIGYDGTDAAEAALVAAVEVARRDDATIEVVEVVEPVAAIASAGTSGAAYPGAALEDRYDRAETDLARITREHGLHGSIATGTATHELADASRGADLLAVGLRQHSSLYRLLEGSVGSALVRGHAAPMLLVPATPPA